MFFLLALVLMLPFSIWQGQAQKRRSLLPHELNLRRATQPLGVAAVAAWAAWQFGTRDIGELLRPIMQKPAEHWLAAVLLCAVPLYGLASFIIGARRCWGMRSDSMLPVWAFLELAAGVAGLRALGVWGDGLTRALDLGRELRLLLVAVAIWCMVVGASRFVLLTIGGGNARARITKHIEQTQVVMRSAQPRPWWQFW